MPASLRVDDRPGGVRVLTLSNPGRKNAIDGSLLDALDAVLSSSDDVRAFLVTGDGDGIFSAGWDLNDLSTYAEGARLPDEHLSDVLDRLMAHPAPSVAAIDGPAFGAACELAMACDFRVGGARAVLSMPPARLGVVYSLKGLDRFRSRVGDATARYLFLTGRRVGADEALRRGLLDEVASAPLEAAGKLCAELASNAPLAVSGLKRGLELLAHGGGTTEARTEYQALRRRSFNSADAAEGRMAILEKRAPNFRGE
ncbi:MAG: enoyl-CoA hydratase/isomerase family protein [Archangiaceae bacterium]|nr:enoyl-CoA hydratase/isomerase family protein [Archangiaceae bacterium]